MLSSKLNFYFLSISFKLFFSIYLYLYFFINTSKSFLSNFLSLYLPIIYLVFLTNFKHLLIYLIFSKNFLLHLNSLKCFLPGSQPISIQRFKILKYIFFLTFKTFLLIYFNFLALINFYYFSIFFISFILAINNLSH